MGPTYRIAYLLNGQWHWFCWSGNSGEIWASCCNETAERQAARIENVEQTRVVWAFGNDHKLPVNPVLTEKEICIRAANVLHGLKSSDMSAFEVLVAGDLLNAGYLRFASDKNTLEANLEKWS